MKLNIKQIAEMAQVSKGTVSKVLNGHKGISLATRERVLTLVEKLDYHRDASARALALQRTGALGFLIPHDAETSFAGQYWSSILAGISHQATAAGYNLMVITTPRDGSIQGVVNQLLKRSTVDGLIIGGELLDKQDLSSLIVHKVPFVLLGQQTQFSHHVVDVENHLGTSQLVHHMIDQGYRHIGALLGPARYPYVSERSRGYQDTLAQRGLEWTAQANTEYTSADIRKTLNELLDRRPGMDALFLASGGDFMFDAFHVLRDRGYQTPEFGLGVFDDYSFLDVMTPRITAVSQPLAKIGEAAVDLLLKVMLESPASSQLIELPTKLVIRESCGEKLGNRLP
jgi:LacI family transcriptional regulator